MNFDKVINIFEAEVAKPELSVKDLINRLAAIKKAMPEAEAQDNKDRIHRLKVAEEKIYSLLARLGVQDPERENKKAEDRFENSMDRTTLKRLENIASANQKRVEIKKSKEEQMADATRKSNFGSDNKHAESGFKKCRLMLADLLAVITGSEGDVKLKVVKDEEGNMVRKTFFYPNEEAVKAKFEKLKTNLHTTLDDIDRNYLESLKNKDASKFITNLSRKVKSLSWDELDFSKKMRDAQHQVRAEAGILKAKNPDAELKLDQYPSKMKPSFNQDILREFITDLRQLAKYSNNTKDLIDDQLSDREEDREARYKNMNKVLTNGSEKDYESARAREKVLDNVTNSAEQRREALQKIKELAKTAKTTEELKELAKAKADARKEYDANRHAAKNLSGQESANDFCKRVGIEVSTPKKAKERISSWGDAKAVVMGIIPGYNSTSGELWLVPNFKATSDNAIVIDGKTLVKVTAKSYSQLKPDEIPHFEDGRKNAELKAKIKEKIAAAKPIKESIFGY